MDSAIMVRKLKSRATASKIALPLVEWGGLPTRRKRNVLSVVALFLSIDGIASYTYVKRSDVLSTRFCRLSLYSALAKLLFIMHQGRHRDHRKDSDHLSGKRQLAS
jgi:hypothetical protein